MKVDLVTPGGPLARIQELAKAAEAGGFSGLVFVESGRTAFLSATAAALTAPSLDLATGIAVAFSRSPMVTAQLAWELADVTGGRFRLGLGTQVRAHIERRFSAAFDHPGPRLREYVSALRAIFAAFRGEERLDFKGDFYSFSLLTPPWSPGRIVHDHPTIDVAGVNPWMLRMAGEVADGLHVHPLNHPAWLRDTVLAAVAEGAARAGRDPAALTLFVPTFVAAGDTEESLAAARDGVRRQIAFYGSTPNYAFLFDELGFEGTTERLRAHQKAGNAEAMATEISDELLDHLSVCGPWDELAGRLVERHRGVADRVVLYLTGEDVFGGRDDIERWGAVAAEVVRRSAAG
ncbi:MAG: TIGR03617 family F420-dependent LLM class oxidoreductase [Acidimicrobiia bacterium]